MTYFVKLYRYDGKGKGIDSDYGFPTIAEARKHAYRQLDHNTSKYNKKGEYKAVIWYTKSILDDIEVVGEVLNTAFDDRYWYPTRKVIRTNFRKYPLYKDGSLGKGTW